MPDKIRLGELLLEHHILSEQQLDDALTVQVATQGRLGRILVEQGYVTEEELLSFLSQQLELPYIDLIHYDFDEQAIAQLPETYARRYRAIILRASASQLLIGMADPLDLYAQDELARYFKRTPHWAIVREADLLRSLDLVYRRTQEITNFAEQLDDQLEKTEAAQDKKNLLEEAGDDAPVVKLLQSLFEDALQIGASDIHIEPDEGLLRIRERVDGVLQEYIVNETRIAGSMTVRLKLMANLNISERRLPQDGRFHIQVRDRTIDVRLSTLPSQHGESIVMRLLDQTNTPLGLQQLQLPEQQLAQLRQLIKSPHGMLLVTGPTGSGKTTTLYSALAELNQEQTKIITVEDPVEYRLPRVIQVQVDEKIGLSFAKVLRTALRQDPDVMLVGEIRDQETATIALRAALTGHLVLATLHTNDAASSAIRLLDMGMQGFVVASSLKGVLAQRLVRRICRDCEEPEELDEQQQAWLATICPEALSYTFKRGHGCAYCHHSGYRGRQGIYDLLMLDQAMIEALRRDDPADFMLQAKRQSPGLLHAALQVAQQGVTTLSEVMRVAGDN